MVAKSKPKSKAPVHNEVKPAHAGTTVPSDVPSGKVIEQEIQRLKDPDEIVRSTAAAALGYSKSEKAVAPLILALKDPHVYVRHGAAWALGEMKSDKAVDALQNALHDEDEVTRWKAAEALGKIQGH
jgi:HEAT repeat protein